MLGAIHEPAVLLVKDARGHPFADDDQVELAVAVIVQPRRRRDHADRIESGSELRGDVPELPAAVVLEQIASRRDAVAARDHATAGKNEVPARHDARAVVKELGKRGGRAAEIPVAIVEIQPIAQRVALPEFVAAAHHVEVEVAITVSVEEGGIHVLLQAIGSKGRLGQTVKPTAPVLHEQLAGLPLRAPNVDVVPTIAVDVADGERRAFGRQQMRHERLASEVEESVLAMFVADGHPIGDVQEDGRMGGWADRRLDLRIGLRECDSSVCGEVREHLSAPVGPHDGK